MENEHIRWERWAEQLEQVGLRDFCAWLLGASGPVTLLGAQFVYLSQPVLGVFFSNAGLNALAHTLETPERTQNFIAFLQSYPAHSQGTRDGADA